MSVIAVNDLVYVVCSVFHPGAHLDVQLQSIVSQSHENWRLRLRNDGGDPETAARLERWRARDDRIEVVTGEERRLGTIRSYELLCRHALDEGAEWLALADQDDVWLPHRIEAGLEVARGGGADDATPTLVHGDLELIDAEDRRLGDSFFAHQHIHHEEHDPLRVLVVQNFVTGCSVLLNRALLEIALPFPEAAIMHDWWLALCAAASGRLCVTQDAGVRYRQHGANQIGAKSHGDVVRELGRRTLSLTRGSNTEFRATVGQVRALKDRLDSVSGSAGPTAAANDEESRDFLAAYLSLFSPDVSRLWRTLGLIRLRVRRQDFLLDMSFKAKCLTTRFEGM